jgi:tRNA(Phe) wybutosine-synthesizing methylase Tyw3
LGNFKTIYERGGNIMANKAKSLNDKAKEILELAEKNGVQTNFFFTTTFQRYLVQIKILEDLEREIEEAGATVTKEYVKGRGNVYTNPAINAYNGTTNSANKTVTTLLKIVQGFKAEDKEKEIDPLMEIIDGGGED